MLRYHQSGKSPATTRKRDPIKHDGCASTACHYPSCMHDSAQHTATRQFSPVVVVAASNISLLHSIARLRNVTRAVFEAAAYGVRS